MGAAMELGVVRIVTDTLYRLVCGTINGVVGGRDLPGDIVTHGFDWDAAFAGRAGRMRASEIRELLKLLGQPDIISFAGGIPDPALFPRSEIEDACAVVLSGYESAALALQYSVTEGYPPLREWIAGHMRRRGVGCSIDNIVITSGSQQGLDLLAKLFLSPGDTALVTAPTYLGALQAFSAYEPRYDVLDPAAPLDAAAYAARAGDHGRVRLAYVVPDFANPTGETIPVSDRLHLLRLTSELGVPLIEDAAYEALRFEGTEVRPCLAIDAERRGHIDRSHVAYCGTFSKTISPGLRVGWLCGARDLIQKVVLAKQATDLHSATLNQVVMDRVVSARYQKQVRANVAAYRTRRDAMMAALSRHMPPAVDWTRPAGGMFVWVRLPEHIDAAGLLARSLGSERVAFVPGAAFFADGSGANTLRLNFSLQPPDRIHEGIRRLARLIGGERGRTSPEALRDAS